MRKKIKSFLFSAVLAFYLGGFFVAAQEIDPPSARYFIYSQNVFLKTIFGVEHSFNNGFTTNLTDFQLSLIRTFGIKTEQVDYYKIAALNESAPPMKVLLKEGVSQDREIFPQEQISWAIKKIYNDPEILKTSGGQRVNIAILDTGIAKNHPDLVARVKTCRDFTKGAPPKNNCQDQNGHGTHLAGIVAGDGGFDGKGIFGMAPEANLHIYKVCDNFGYCLADDVASALSFIARLKDNKINIILMGFGGPKNSPLVESAIKNIAQQNVLIIAPAGNNGPASNSVNFPAFLKEVISVGFVNQRSEVVRESSRGLNPGQNEYLKDDGEVEVVAPGTSIESTWLDSDYKILGGSSRAAALIAGLAAKIWEQNDSSALKVRGEIARLAILNDLEPKGDDSKSGFGMPVLEKAVLEDSATQNFIKDTQARPE